MYNQYPNSNQPGRGPPGSAPGGQAQFFAPPGGAPTGSTYNTPGMPPTNQFSQMSLGGRPPAPGPPPQSGGPPPMMGAPPGGMNAPPPMMGAPPGGMYSNMGRPGPPGGMSAPPPMMGAPPGSNMGRPGPPGGMSAPPGAMSAPSTNMGRPPASMPGMVAPRAPMTATSAPPVSMVTPAPAPKVNAAFMNPNSVSGATSGGMSTPVMSVPMMAPPAAPGTSSEILPPAPPGVSRSSGGVGHHMMPPKGPPSAGGPPGAAFGGPASANRPTVGTFNRAGPPTGAPGSSGFVTAGPPTGPPASGGMGASYGGPASMVTPGARVPGMGGMPEPEQMATIDEAANCAERYMSMTTKAIPSSSSVAQSAHIPVACVLQPLAESEEQDRNPVVNFGSCNVIRCKRCRAYINPFVQWMDNGRRWKCNMCSLPNDVPSLYFCHLDMNGKRTDAAERPELSKGSVEIMAPAEYMVRPPQAPVYVFVIDVSYASVSSGALKATTAAIKECLDGLPGAPRTQVGFLTFDSSVHFYNLNSKLNAPQMLVVSDLQDLFLPLPDDLLVNLSDSREMVNTLLENLPSMHSGTRNTDTCLGAAMTAAFRVMAHIGGKMVVLCGGLPSKGDGALKHREVASLRGTDTEHTLLAPGSGYYKAQAVEMSRQQICVDLFIAAPQFADVATLSALPRYTGGQLYHYPEFAAHTPRDRLRLRRDLVRTLTRETGFEAVLRVRVSRGFRITNFMGNFFIRGTDLLALPNVTADSSFVVQIEPDGATQLTQSERTVCIQSALLYTTSAGERRIRVQTVCLPLVSSVGALLSSAKIDVLANVMGRMATDVALKTGIPSAREWLQRRCVNMMRAYRAGGAGYGSTGPASQQQNSLGLPEALQLLPLYTMALIKNEAFRGGNDIPVDRRAYLMHFLAAMPARVSRVFLYPRMFGLHAMPPTAGTLVPEGTKVEGDTVTLSGNRGRVHMPPLVNLSSERLTSAGAFLLDDGVSLTLWLGRALSPAFVQGLFGIPSLDSIEPSTLKLPCDAAPEGDDGSDGMLTVGHDSALVARVCNVIAACRDLRPLFPALYIVKEGDGCEPAFMRHLVEDRAVFTGGAFTYGEFLNHVTRLSQTGAAQSHPVR